MNGAHLTLGLVGLAAAGAAARGSANYGKSARVLFQEQVRPDLWVRVYLAEFPWGRQLGVALIRSPLLELDFADEHHDWNLGHVLADDSRNYKRGIWPSCRRSLDDLVRAGAVDGLFIVGQSELAASQIGKGLGLAMYDALVRAAGSLGCAVSPHWCARGGNVSERAKKVWRSLAERYPHVGDADYMRAEEDDGSPDFGESETKGPLIVWATRRAGSAALSRGVEVGDLVTCRTCKKKTGSRSVHLPFGTELEHPVWGQARIIGRYDHDSWEARNRKGHTVIRDHEIPEWRITYMPDVPAEEER